MRPPPLPCHLAGPPRCLFIDKLLQRSRSCLGNVQLSVDFIELSSGDLGTGAGPGIIEQRGNVT